MMKHLTIEITEATGLHARPAAALAALAKRFSSSITISFGTKEANARNIISVLALGLKQGSSIQVKVEGADSTEASTELLHFFNNLSSC